MSLFGRGSLLHAIVATTALGVAAHFVFPSSTATWIALAVIPVALTFVSWPAFPEPGSWTPRITLVTVPMIGSLVYMFLRLAVKPDGEWSPAAPFLAFFPEEIIAIAVLTILLFAVLRMEQRVPTLGPFFLYQRRAAVLCVGALTMTVVATALHSGNVVLAASFLAWAMGFAGALLIVLGCFAWVDAWEPLDAPAYRWALVDVLATLSMVGTGSLTVLRYTPVGGWVSQALDFARARIFDVLRSLAPSVHQHKVNVFDDEDWATAAMLSVSAIAIFALAVLALHYTARSHPFLAPVAAEVAFRGSPRKKTVALTIDGLPETTEQLEEIVEALEERSARATFFVTPGELHEREKDVETLLELKHEVGILAEPGVDIELIHRAREQLSNQIREFFQLETKAVPEDVPDFPLIEDIEEDEEDIPLWMQAAGGGAPLVQWYRPVDASRNISEMRTANALGLTVALWSICPWDWDATKADIALRMSRHLPLAGAIVRLHGWVPPSLRPPAAAHRPTPRPVAAVEAVLDSSMAAGVGVRTLSEVCPRHGIGMEVNPWLPSKTT